VWEGDQGRRRVGGDATRGAAERKVMKLVVRNWGEAGYAAVDGVHSVAVWGLGEGGVVVVSVGERTVCSGRERRVRKVGRA
jgi:hypothetical protein